MPSFRKPDSKIMAGLSITAILFFILAVIFLTVEWPCGVQERCSFLMAFQDLELNELGDLLAGIFSPIAFLWLVLAVLIQSEQLKAQRTELMNLVVEQQETRRVLSEQAEAAKASANFIRSQTDVLILNNNVEKFESAISRFIQTCVHPMVGKEILLIGPALVNNHEFEKKFYKIENSEVTLIDRNLQIILDATVYFLKEGENGWMVEDFSNRFIGMADQLFNFNHWKEIPEDAISKERIDMLKKLWSNVQKLARLQWGGAQPDQYLGFWQEERYASAKRLIRQIS